MSIIKSFSVGNGDMFYIRHDADSFSIIDCCMDEDRRLEILQELINESRDKTIRRFISTHPDDDHIRGLEYLNRYMPIENFYCVENRVIKRHATDDFNQYRLLRDSGKAYYLKRGCRRKWLNQTDHQIGGAGIHILWPDTNDQNYVTALLQSLVGHSPNNISPIIEYFFEYGKILWMGDLETDFMEKIGIPPSLGKIDVLFAPHHGRDSGKIPESWLHVMDPKVIVIGEASSEHLNYYSSYNTIKQNSAGSLLFECVGHEINVYAENISYREGFLWRKYPPPRNCDLFYIGTLTCHSSWTYLVRTLRGLNSDRNFL